MIVVTASKFETVKYPLRKFFSYINSLRKEGYDIYDDSIRDTIADIVTRENELNDLMTSVFGTDKRYDFLEFSRYNLPPYSKYMIISSLCISYTGLRPSLAALKKVIQTSSAICITLLQLTYKYAIIKSWLGPQYDFTSSRCSY